MSNTVVCVHCNRPLYRLESAKYAHCGDIVKPSDFIPINKDIIKPEYGKEMLCTFCGECFALPANNENTGLVVKMDDESYWPHPPMLD